MLKSLVAAFFLFCLASPLVARATVPGDYDSDGRSDITVVREAGGYLHWFIRYANGVENFPVLFGLKGDQVYAGDFDGDGRFEPGVIRQGAQGLLNWYTMAPDGSAVERQWGLQGDVTLTGNFNYDNAADLIAARKSGGLLFWHIYVSNVGYGLDQWGLSSDTPFVGDLNGDDVDEIIAMRREGGGIMWYVKALGGAPMANVQWGLAGDRALPPYDLNGDKHDDFIVVRELGGQLHAFIRYNGYNGVQIGFGIVPFGLKGDIPFTGTFFNHGAGDFGVYRPGAQSVHFLHFVNAFGQNDGLGVPFGLGGDILVQPLGKVKLRVVPAPGQGSRRFVPQ